MINKTEKSKKDYFLMMNVKTKLNYLSFSGSVWLPRTQNTWYIIERIVFYHYHFYQYSYEHVSIQWYKWYTLYVPHQLIWSQLIDTLILITTMSSVYISYPPWSIWLLIFIIVRRVHMHLICIVLNRRPRYAYIHFYKTMFRKIVLKAWSIFYVEYCSYGNIY